MKWERLFRLLPLFKRTMFKIPITIFKKRGDTYIPYYDYGRIVKFIGKKGGTHRIFLRIENAYAPFPSSPYIRGDKSIAYIESGDKNYTAAQIIVEKEDEIILKAFEDAITLAKAAITQEIRETVETVKKPSFWDKYGNVILPIVYFAVAGLIIVMILKQSTSVTGQLGGVAKQIGGIVDKLKGVSDVIGTGINQTAPPV